MLSLWSVPIRAFRRKVSVRLPPQADSLRRQNLDPATAPIAMLSYKFAALPVIRTS
jgi:hypothetical protein